jgi:hypothetical protein
MVRHIISLSHWTQIIQISDFLHWEITALWVKTIFGKSHTKRKPGAIHDSSIYELVTNVI